MNIPFIIAGLSKRKDTMRLCGAFTAMITPFRNGSIDEAALRRQIEDQIAGGISGLVPVGTTGESPTLDFKEHEKMIRMTVEIVNKRVPVIAGTGANSTAEALELHQYAKSVGADACLSVNPYYNKPTQEGLYQHFMTLADKVDLPIMLYNIPSRCGITMSAQTVARLAKNPLFVAMKEATGNIDMASEIRSLCDMTILSGDDSLTLPYMSVGAQGVVSVMSNLLPAQVSKIAKLALDQKYAEAEKIHRSLFPLIKGLFADGNPVGIKAAMKLAGKDTGELRLPLWQASEGTVKIIADQLKKLGII